MKTLWFQICLVISAMIGAFLVVHLSDEELALLIGGGLGLCALLGWVLTFQNKAVKVRYGLLWSVLGNLQPIPAKWIQPLQISWPARFMLVVAALILGAIARIFLMINA